MTDELREHRHALAASFERLRGDLLAIEESLQVADEWLESAEPVYALDDDGLAGDEEAGPFADEEFEGDDEAAARKEKEDDYAA